MLALGQLQDRNGKRCAQPLAEDLRKHGRGGEETESLPGVDNDNEEEN
jgi:hypothetical protein